mmetsp:Transcript_709/g.2338  ORF Transcript_709/g.2338 Transcript_709/m.2338 type:complete len:171 (+) Transcript_709:251-763(+)
MEAAGLGGLNAFNFLVRKAFTKAVNRLELNEAAREILWSAALSVRGSGTTVLSPHSRSMRASCITPAHSLPSSQRGSHALQPMPISPAHTLGASPVHSVVASQRSSRTSTLGTEAHVPLPSSCGASAGGILGRLSSPLSWQPTLGGWLSDRASLAGPGRHSSRCTDSEMV